MKQGVYHALEHARRMAQAEWHNVEIIEAVGGNECGLSIIALGNGNPPITTPEIQRVKVRRSLQRAQHVIHPWLKIDVLVCHLVKSEIINAEAQCSVFLFQNEPW